jgi:LL-diaminopimelate aminotransferase
LSYVTQRGAEAALSPENEPAARSIVDYYLENARLLRSGLTAAGLTVYGGVDAPFLWIKAPRGWSSWEFFDFLLERAHLVGMPGSGFGAAGAGYLRLSAFARRDSIHDAVRRLAAVPMVVPVAVEALYEP